MLSRALLEVEVRDPRGLLTLLPGPNIPEMISCLTMVCPVVLSSGDDVPLLAFF
jgi:hypothetical protein